jgi:DNA-binding HxlR family transcriptional regulator
MTACPDRYGDQQHAADHEARRPASNFALAHTQTAACARLLPAWHGARALTAGEWVPAVMLTLLASPLRYTAILSAVRSRDTDMSARRHETLHDSVLARTLRRMADDGLLDRSERTGVFPPSVLYALTPPARERLDARQNGANDLHKSRCQDFASRGSGVRIPSAPIWLSVSGWFR